MLNKRKLCWVFFMLFAFTGYKSVFSQNLDIDILKSINPEHPNSLYWRNTSNSAYYAAGAATFGSLAVGLFSGNKTITHNGIEAAINLGVTVLVTDIIKISVNRTRPADRYPNDVFVLSPSHDQSFPSGHTSLAFATATTLALQYHKWYVTVPAFVWASSVGYSRMYLGKHYPSDVLMGAAVGIATTYAGHWLNKKLLVNHKSSSAYHD